MNWRASLTGLGGIVGQFTTIECANYFTNSGYPSN